MLTIRIQQKTCDENDSIFILMRKLFVNVTKLLSETMVFFYAVARGRNPGVYSTWAECQAQVNKFPNPRFKKFPSKSEAESFIQSEGGSGLRIKLSEGINIANVDNFRQDVAAPRSKSSPYDELENRLKLWAQTKRRLSQLDVQTEASRVAEELGIENFNGYGGWLKHHIECNPDIYKSLRSGDKSSVSGEVSDSDIQLEPENANLMKKLSRLECRISGIAANGVSIPGRIKILEQNLYSMHQELHEIKRLFSTHTAGDGRTAASSSSLKRKKFRQSSDSEDSNASSETEIGSRAPGTFHTDAEGFVHVYTDGACSSNGRSGAAAGIGVWFGQDHPLNVSRPVKQGSRATNNLAEIQAVTAAAQQARKAGVKKLKINTDSQFLISCITQWMPKWKRNGWKKSDGDKVINKDELLEMEKALKPLTIAWNHVRGHAGVHGNEMADELARAGAAAQRK